MKTYEQQLIWFIEYMGRLVFHHESTVRKDCARMGISDETVNRLRKDAKVVARGENWRMPYKKGRKKGSTPRPDYNSRWLLHMLSRKGYANSARIKRRAAAVDISEAQLRTARNTLGVIIIHRISHKTGRRITLWLLPERNVTLQSMSSKTPPDVFVR